MPKVKKGRFVIWILCFILVMIALFSFIAWRIVCYGNTDEKKVADVAIVLGAGTMDGEVSLVYQERINHGIWLYKNGYVEYVILTGGIGEGSSMSDAEAAKRYALTQGIPGEAILLEDRSTITEENLEYAKEIMEAESLLTALVVSDPIHMKRAMMMAKDYKIVAYSSPTPTTMYKSIKTKFPFLVREVFLYIGYAVVRLFC